MIKIPFIRKGVYHKESEKRGNSKREKYLRKILVLFILYTYVLILY